MSESSLGVATTADCQRRVASWFGWRYVTIEFLLVLKSRHMMHLYIHHHFCFCLDYKIWCIGNERCLIIWLKTDGGVIVKHFVSMQTFLTCNIITADQSVSYWVMNKVTPLTDLQLGTVQLATSIEQTHYFASRLRKDVFFERFENRFQYLSSIIIRNQKLCSC